MPIDPRRVKELFHAALNLPDPADRPAFLDRECGDDPELRARLDELLAAHDRPASALVRPLAGNPGETAALVDAEPRPTLAATGHPAGAGGSSETVAGPTASFPPSEGAAPVVGTVIAGRYKVRQEIGEGGMGSVYLAEQIHPVKRQVALKLIKPGMDSRTVLARFESERQALALMDHPNIARVLDAGSTDAGRPFFVMDLVKGVPLTGYCDAHRLDLPARLAIFRQVCSAVQHAHQKGIIHRDLKPTNILVESHDGHPVPKVIDFGLAKATSGMPLTDRSLFTAFGSVTGTPLYMAPEQATFNALDVDTRADIYALGVILYELLTGSTPIRRDTVRRAALDEMLRVIREDDPPTPSSRISTSEGLPGLAASRHIEPSRLSRFVRGDLDWIVMKALAKERHRRYDSAIGLADDIERFTNDEPVSAGPPTAGYRLRKFVRRHRRQVVAASLVLLALVGGVVGTTVGLIEARRQEARAIVAVGLKDKALQAEADQRRQAERRLARIEKATEILNEIFMALQGVVMQKENRPLAKLLGERVDRMTSEIEGEAIGDPLAVARMQRALGMIQYALGFPEKAVGLYAKSRATFASRLGPDHFDTLSGMDHLAYGYRAADRLDRALPLLEEALASRKRRFGPDHPDTLDSMDRLAGNYFVAGQFNRALPLLEEALASRKRRFGPDHPDTLGKTYDLAYDYLIAGRLDRALTLSQEALARARAKLGPDNSLTLVGMGAVAECYRDAGQLDRALTLSREVDDLWGRQVGPDSPRNGASLVLIGSVLLRQGKWAEAEPVLREALATRQYQVAFGWWTQNAKSMLGGALLGQGKYADAEPLLRSGFEELNAQMERSTPWVKARTYEALDRLIELAEVTGKPDEAKAWRDEKARLTVGVTSNPPPGKE